MSYAERFRPPRSKRAGTGAVLPEAYAAGMPSVGLRIAISSFLVNFVRARGKGSCNGIDGTGEEEIGPTISRLQDPPT